VFELIPYSLLDRPNIELSSSLDRPNIELSSAHTIIQGWYSIIV